MKYPILPVNNPGSILLATFVTVALCACATTRSVDTSAKNVRAGDKVMHCAVIAEHSTLSIHSSQYGNSTGDGLAFAERLAKPFVTALKGRGINASLVPEEKSEVAYSDASIDTIILIKNTGFNTGSIPPDSYFQIRVLRMPEKRVAMTVTTTVSAHTLFNSWEKPVQDILGKVLDDNASLK